MGCISSKECAVVGDAGSHDGAAPAPQLAAKHADTVVVISPSHVQPVARQGLRAQNGLDADCKPDSIREASVTSMASAARVRFASVDMGSSDASADASVAVITAPTLAPANAADNDVPAATATANAATSFESAADADAAAKCPVATDAPSPAENGAIGRFRCNQARHPVLEEEPSAPLEAAATGTGGRFEVLRSQRTSKLRDRRGGLEQSSFMSLQSSLATESCHVPIVSTRAAGLKHIGFGPFKRENQDEFFIQVGDFGGVPGANLFCVFDGHGTHGKHAADMSRQTLPVLLDNEMRAYLARVANPEDGIKGAVEVLITEVFGETERSIQKAGVNLASSGTTASVAYQRGNRIWVAAAGDSRVIMICRTPDGMFRAQPLTIDHRPRRPSERVRVEAAGGRVAPKRLPSGRCVGEPRLWLQDLPSPGLLLSRSLGDLMAASVGCTSDPEITYVTARPETDAYMVMASDGVWDVLSNEQVCDIVVESREPQIACRRVLDAALYEWEERMSADNITVLVVEFDWAGTPLREGHAALDQLCLGGDEHDDDDASVSDDEEEEEEEELMATGATVGGTWLSAAAAAPYAFRHRPEAGGGAAGEVALDGGPADAATRS